MPDMIKYLLALNYRTPDIFGREVDEMGFGCCGPSGGCSPNRSFLTREEKIEMLKEYASDLELESKGVKERIKELEKAG